MIEPPGAASIRIDLRQLDDVRLLVDDDSDEDENGATADREDARKADAADGREARKSILLVLDELEIALYIADGRAAARQLVRDAKEWLDGTKVPVQQSPKTLPSSVVSRDAKLVVLSSLHPDDAVGKDDDLAGTVFDLVWPQATIGRTEETAQR